VVAQLLRVRTRVGLPWTGEAAAPGSGTVALTPTRRI